MMSEAIALARPPLIAGTLATLTIKYAALPLLEPFTAAIEAVIPHSLLPFYNPQRDQTPTLMSLAGLLGFVLMALCICSPLDALSKYTHTLKTQGHKSFFTLSEYCQALGIAFSNFFIFSWFVSIPAWQLHKRGGLRSGTPLASWDEELHLGWAALHFIVHVLIIDVWFYLTHRALHWRSLYGPIHKFHHRFKAPTAVACVYAHPVEYCIGNAAGVILGPTLTNCHPLSAGFWMAFSLISTAMSHSGYAFLGAENHDLHHEHFDYNFGVGVFMDKLLGTGFEGSEREAAILKKAKRA